MLGKGWFGVVVLSLVACAGKAEDASPTGGSAGNGAGGHAGSSATAGSSKLSPCDPLAAVTTPVQLEASQIVAAGQASDDTLYVIYADNRLFVGTDTNLVERVVTGSGETGSQTDLDYTDDDGAPVTVEVVNDDIGMHMSVAHGSQKSKGIDAGNGEPLTLLDAAVVAKFDASTTQTFEVDFAASLPDDRVLVVVAPTHAGGYDEFRTFLGPASALAQRVTTDFGSTRSGQRFASVTIDGKLADLTYLAGGPSELNPAGGPSTLTIAGTANPLTEGAVPSDASYLCLSN